MGMGWWDSGWTFNASRNGQTVTLTLSATARYSDYGSRSWSFRLYKNGSATSTYFTGWSTGGTQGYQYAQFSNASVTYTLSGSDLGTTVTFKVVGTCNGDPFYDGTDGFAYQPNASVSVPSPTITWSTGATLSISQTSDMKARVQRNGSVSVGNGFSGTVYYRVYCESTVKVSASQADTWDVTPNSLDTELTYYVEGYASIWGSERTSSRIQAKFTVVSGNYIDYFDGTNWVQCKAYYYDGSSWVECKPFYYDGTSWVECSS